ncbi:RING-H2 finger protein ATL66-like [Primulina tabacum]|uniref:RING-H2 finger protein ATL66-like n=1 Tax=Primulina tabacum TaxID=48773 RepID=UPI003F5AD8EE
MIMEIVLSVTLLFVGIAALVIIHICVVGRAFSGDFPGRASISDPSRTIRIPSMRQEDIKELPCFDYKVEENGNRECSVCLENFKNGETCKKLPKCSHSFHSECIDSWLLKTAACPICRASVGSLHFEQVHNRSHSDEVGVELV